LRGSPALDGPDGASADLGGALGTYRRSLDTRFHGDDQCGHTVEAARNRRANGRARLASQAQLSGPQESVTASENCAWGPRACRLGQPGIWPDGWCVKAGLIECDLALAVCAKLLTIEIFFTGNRHCLFSNSPPGRLPLVRCAIRLGHRHRRALPRGRGRTRRHPGAAELFAPCHRLQPYAGFGDVDPGNQRAHPDTRNIGLSEGQKVARIGEIFRPYHDRFLRISSWRCGHEPCMDGARGVTISEAFGCSHVSRPMSAAVLRNALIKKRHPTLAGCRVA
jgi:hypothetical protein